MSHTLTQEKFSVAAKKRLIERGLTITALAVELGFARNTVSMAINHPILPTVRRKIVRHLRLEGVA
jgi:predicted transcriptional regulator